MNNASTARPIIARKLIWDFSRSTNPHWLGGRPFLTRLLDVYTLLVPDNERYYIRSMQSCLELIPNDEHRAELREFFRQESLHGIAHKKYWNKLAEQGLNVQRFVTTVNTFLYKILEPFQPRWLKISVLAAIEHINACLGNVILDKGLLQGATPELKRLFEWHFAEEIEHKVVAHNALDALYPGFIRRITGAALVFPIFFMIRILGTVYLLAQERELVKPKTLHDAAQFLFTDGVCAMIMSHLGRYFRRGFQPWDLDDYYLAKEVFDRGKLERDQQARFQLRIDKVRFAS